MTITFVVPCWNDAARLEAVLKSLARLEPRPEVVVADASQDRAPVRKLSAELGAEYVGVERPNRGAQMNAGAGRASGDVLVFHHADTEFTQAHLDALLAAMQDRRLDAGAFYKDIRSHFPMVAWSEPIVRWYSNRIGVLYGDQSLFIRRRQFDSIGGFRDIPLMEDVDLSSRLRRCCRVRLIDPPIRTSMRKFHAEGTLWRKVQNMSFVLLFRAGVSPQRLHRWYYRWNNVGPGAD